MMRTLIIGLLCVVCCRICLGEERPDKAAEQRILTLYKQFLSAIDWKKPGLEKAYDEIPNSENMRLSKLHGRLPTYWVEGPLRFHIDPSSFKLKVLWNQPLALLTGPWRKEVSPPELPIEKVIARAKEYLKAVDMELPEHMVLTSVQYNSVDRPLCWWVIWKPFFGGNPPDDFLEPIEQHMDVAFHETLGLLSVVTTCDWPVPKSVEVKISREDAIILASKVASLVMKTPYYQQARVPGFVIKSVKEANLKVAPPNWLLDPKRAIWIPGYHPPTETRFCWIVIFGTMDTVERDHDFKPIAPDILVYVDAVTGEVVGANFT